MNDGLVFRVTRTVAGHPVAETTANGDDQVGIGYRQVSRLVAMHAGKSQIVRLMGFYGAQSH